MPVDRCVCHDVSFERLKQDAERHGGGLEQLQRRFGCGTGCGLCVPYILAMLRTGRVVFEVDDPDARRPSQEVP